MTLKLNETIVPAIQARLTANLPAIVTDINTNNTSPTYPIDQIAQVLDYIPPVSDLFQFPTIGISDGPIDLEDDVGFGATGVHEFSCVLFVQNADQRTLAWQLRRYAQAIIRALRAPTNFNLGDGWGMYRFHVRPGPTLGRQSTPGQFVSTLGVSFFVKSEQDA
jgi:hypothetical protein